MELPTPLYGLVLPYAVNELFSEAARNRCSTLRKTALKAFGSDGQAWSDILTPSDSLGGKSPIHIASRSDEGLAQALNYVKRFEKAVFTPPRGGSGVPALRH